MNWRHVREAVADVEGVAGCGVVVEGEQGGVDQVLHVAEPRHRAPAVDQQHVAGADRPGDLTDHLRGAGAVDGRGAKDEGVKAAVGFGAADLGLGFELALGVPVAKACAVVGLIDPRAVGVAVDVGGAEVDEAGDAGLGRGIEQAARAEHVDGGDLLLGGPVGDERTAMEDVTAALDRASERARDR